MGVRETDEEELPNKQINHLREVFVAIFDGVEERRHSFKVGVVRVHSMVDQVLIDRLASVLEEGAGGGERKGRGSRERGGRGR